MSIIFETYEVYLLIGLVTIFAFLLLLIRNWFISNYNKAVDHAKLIIVKIDKEGNIIKQNNRFAQLMDNFNHKVHSFQDLFSEKNKKMYYDLLFSLNERKVNSKVILTTNNKDYHYLFTSIVYKKHYKLMGINITKTSELENDLITSQDSLSHIKDELTKKNLILQQSQIKLLENEKKLWNFIHIDSLTNIYNKNYFIARCETILENSNNYGVLVLIDIDNIDRCNNIFGPYKVDEIIKEIATKIDKINKNEHLLARLSSNQFVILLTNVEYNEIEIYIEEIIASNTYSITYKDVSLQISISAGATIFPKNGTSFNDLVKSASLALNSAKEMGNGNLNFYNNLMEKKLLDKMGLESIIREGLENDLFFLVYQPQYNMNTGEIGGFEALLRLRNRDDTLVMPNDFIPVAEETLLIVPLGYWVISQTCLFLNRMKDRGFSPLSVSINVSVVQLLHDDFVKNVKAILTQYKIDPKYFEIEITETSLMHFDAHNLSKISQLREFGINIALDDFGTGYSSLLYFKKSPSISCIKIDKEFVDDLTLHQNNIDIVDAMIYLAHKFHFKVIAEGVEYVEQYDILAKLGCDLMQGYLGSRPINESLVFEGYKSLLNIKDKIDRRDRIEVN